MLAILSGGGQLAAESPVLSAPVLIKNQLDAAVNHRDCDFGGVSSLWGRRSRARRRSAPPQFSGWFTPTIVSQSGTLVLFSQGEPWKLWEELEGHSWERGLEHSSATCHHGQPSDAFIQWWLSNVFLLQGFGGRFSTFQHFTVPKGWGVGGCCKLAVNTLMQICLLFL